MPLLRLHHCGTLTEFQQLKLSLSHPIHHTASVIHRKTLRHCTSVTETFDDNMSKKNIQVDKLPLPSDHLMTTAGTTAGDILLRVLWVVSLITIPWPARCNCLSGWFESGMLNCKRVPRGLLYYQTL